MDEEYTPNGKACPRKLSKGAAHRYWKHPPDEGNKPSAYIENTEVLQKRNSSLGEIFLSHVEKTSSILEIGCNAGRNLSALLDLGYKDLHGVEISQAAIDFMTIKMPHVRDAAKIWVLSIEEFFSRPNVPRYDVILSMAVLVHITPESDWVLERIASCARKKIIIFEPESGEAFSDRHFFRKYNPIFVAGGWEELQARSPVEGFPRSYICRVFARSQSQPDD